MAYVDGYVLPIPKKNLAAYKRMAATACKVWRDHGALDYKECVGQDLRNKWGVAFPRAAKVKGGAADKLSPTAQWHIVNFNYKCPVRS